jgi:hypothetical protein
MTAKRLNISLIFPFYRACYVKIPAFRKNTWIKFPFETGPTVAEVSSFLSDKNSSTAPNWKFRLS